MNARAIDAIRTIGVGAFAGGLAGALVGGLGGRLAMRISGHLTSTGGPLTTSNGNQLGDITFAGTLGLVVFVGLAPGVFAGVLYAVLRPSLRWAGRYRGTVFGTGLLAIAGSLAIEPFNVDFDRFGVAWLNVLMFTAIFVLVGVVLAPLYDLVERSSRGASTMGEVQVLSLLVWLSVIPAVMVIAMTEVIGVTNLATLLRIGAISDADFTTVLLGAVTCAGLAVGLVRETQPRFAPLAHAVLVVAVAVAAFRSITAIVLTLA